ncbi:insulin-degrading enzyme-like 1, peroxisomal [Nicotiana attenuata]|uniref:Insulin-degrading enzyme-like 1, peroxisomal n=1 Tax=Nicotiana attenuata TaxID=49451 RepID=A0A1J6J3E5_NICAT|nr:insulin-degrading enzyme-like 1, peroxisomal [Nicotiana attenuata]
MGSVADTRMIGINCRFEHPSPSVSFQCQQFLVSTSISDFSPKDLWIDEVNPTVIHSNTSFNEERPSRTCVAESCNDAISEVSRETILLSSSIVNVHHPHLTNSSPICEFGADTISSQEVCVPRTSILDVVVANNKDTNSMNLDLEVDLEEHGADKEENRLFVCPSPLDVNTRKMFDEILSSRQDRQAQRLSSQLREIKYSWETTTNLDDRTYLIMEEVKKRETEERNCPLTCEKPGPLVTMVNNKDSCHIIHAPTAAETATGGVFDVEFGEVTEDHELAVARRVSMVEEDLSTIRTGAKEMDARKHKEVEPVATLVDSQNILMGKDEVKVAAEETVKVETDMGTELADICEGPAATKNDVGGNTYFKVQEVGKYIEESSIQLINERPEAINIVLNDNVSSHIIHVPAAVATAVDASPVRDHSQLLEHVFVDPRSCRIDPDPRHKDTQYSLMVNNAVRRTGVYGKDKICDLNFKRKVVELWSKSLMVDYNLKASLSLGLIFTTTIMNEKNVAELIVSQSQVLISTGKMNFIIVEACSPTWVKADATDCTHETVRNSLDIDPPKTFLLAAVVTVMLNYFIQFCQNKNMIYLVKEHQKLKNIMKGITISKWTSFHSIGLSEFERHDGLDETNVTRNGASGRVYKAFSCLVPLAQSLTWSVGVFSSKGVLLDLFDTWKKMKNIRLYVRMFVPVDSYEELSSQRTQVCKILQVEGKTTIVMSHHVMLLVQREPWLLSNTTLASDSDQTPYMRLEETAMQNRVASVIPTTEKSQLYCENGGEIMRIVVPSFTVFQFFALVAEQSAFHQLRSVEQLCCIIVLWQRSGCFVNAIQIVIQSIPKNTKSIGSRVEFLLKLFESKLCEKSCFPFDADTLLKGRAIPDRTAVWLMSITAKIQDFLVLGRYLIISDPGEKGYLEAACKIARVAKSYLSHGCNGYTNGLNAKRTGRNGDSQAQICFPIQNQRPFLLNPTLEQKR